MTNLPRSSPVRLLAGLTGLVAAVALALGLWASPAGAHDGDAVITVEGTHPAGMSIHYIVRVTWANDGHPAADATVTATAEGADGTQLTPVTLAPADSDGRYQGVVDYPAPGAWTVRVTSIDPTGTIEQAQEVTPPPTTTEATDDTSEVTTGSDDGGFAPADDGTGNADDQASATSSASSSDGGGMPVYLVVAAAAVVLIGAVTAVNLIRRNRANPPSTATTSTNGESTGEGDGSTPAAGDAHDPSGRGEPAGDGASAGDPSSTGT